MVEQSSEAATDLTKLSVIVIGHSQAGKSAICGHLLSKLSKEPIMEYAWYES